MMIVRASKTSILLTLLLQLLLGTGAMLLLAGCGAATGGSRAPDDRVRARCGD